jgi:hypothetical protein
MPALRRSYKQYTNRDRNARYSPPPGDWLNLERYEDFYAEYGYEEIDLPVEDRQHPMPFFIPHLAVLSVSFLFFLVLLGLTPIQLVVPSFALPTPNLVPAREGEPIASLNSLAPFFSPSVQYWSEKILAWSAAWELDPNLVATVMQIESCGDPRAQSWAGAMGLFQVMPYHFQPGEDGFDPQTNASRGLSYLKQAYQSAGGDIRLTLAGYNGGITGAKRPAEQWSAETQRYTYWGVGIYTDALEGLLNSQILEEWLAMGGASLCAQAKHRLGIAIP